MNFPYFVARRYFLSKKKKNFINVIAIISMLVVAIGTAALIIVLSVFNGLEKELRYLYSSFDPEMRIQAKLGKSFQDSDSIYNTIVSTEGVEVVTKIIEDNALLKYNDGQMIVRLKGVAENYLDQGRLNGFINYANPGSIPANGKFAIVGQGIMYRLNIKLNNQLKPIQLYYPKNLRRATLNSSNLYTVKAILPGASFAIERQYDDNFVIVPIEFARELFNYKNKLSAFELKLVPGARPQDVQKLLSDRLGDSFNVLRNDEIHADLYKILKLEKLIVFIILSLIIAIASVNIYFSLSMLVLDKKKDISLLYVLGANEKLIRRIFVLEGVIISFSGAIAGLIIGLFVSLIQQEFGIIGMGMETALINAYPVKIQLSDVLYTVISIVVITLLASLPPAKLASKSFSVIEL